MENDSILNVVNCYWDHFNDDIRVLLQQFDAETAYKLENESEATSTLGDSSTWDKKELDEKLANRVQVSKSAVVKIIQTFNKLTQRNNIITLACKRKFEEANSTASNNDETVGQANIGLEAENKKLHALTTSLHNNYHTILSKLADFHNSVNYKEAKIAEMRTQIEDLQHENQTILHRNYKLEAHIEKLKDMLKGVKSMNSDDISKQDITLITKSNIPVHKESNDEYCIKLADNDTYYIIKHVEEHIAQFRKQVSTYKKEKEDLLSEMEVTGLLSGDMQEKNCYTSQQLYEKNNAFRINFIQLRKLVKAETDSYKEWIEILNFQIKMTNNVVNKLQENKHVLENFLEITKTKCLIREKAMEMYKQTAIENSKIVKDLKLYLDTHFKIKEEHQVLKEKTSILEAKEESMQLRQTTERMKKIEPYGKLNEIMIKEIREYEETLTCPMCQVKKK